MKIKAIPVKSKTLCARCYFTYNEHCSGRQKGVCKSCPMNTETKYFCKCLEIKKGEPCRYFVSKEKAEFELIKEKIRRFFK